MARPDRGPIKPTSAATPAQAPGQGLASDAAHPASKPARREQLPLVRVARGKRAAASAAMQICVVCEAPQRATNAKLIAQLHTACIEAGLTASESAAVQVPATSAAEAGTTHNPPATLTLAVVDGHTSAAAPVGCVIVCESINDAVLRAAFASCACAIITQHDCADGSSFLAKLREAQHMLALRTTAHARSTKQSVVSDAAGTTAAASRASKREARLLRAARSIAASRDALAAQLAMVCEQLSQSCMDVSSQISHVAVASELQTLLRQELDIESVLRTSLEFLLRKLGPANAAIYLPSTTGDYTLGAYINYDCPRDGIETTLEHLCDALVPDFADRPGLHILGECERDLPAVTSSWVQDSSMLVFSAHSEGECAAILAVFRDQTTGFDAPARKLAATIGSMLGEQLARIVKTHHRWKAA